MRTSHIVMLADVVDRVNLCRVGVHTAHGVTQHRVVFPTALPQFVGHVEILIRAVVALVVQRQATQAKTGSGVRQIGGDDVPRHPPTREVIEG